MQNVDKYKYFIVDYLKDDCYCINYNDDLKVYEVDISTDKENLKILYDAVSSNTISTIDDYKVTTIIPESSCYIVLRREDL
jgi:hypothetical protein